MLTKSLMILIFPYFSHDFVNIYDGNQKIEEFTGIITASVIRSFSSNMTVQFTSDEFGVKKGFKLKIGFVNLGKF